MKLANRPHDKTLGEVVREARTDKSLSLRDLAKRLDKTPSYLSDIENDRRVPSEEVLRNIAVILDLDFNELMARAGRFGDRAMRYLKRYPAAGMLFRKISDLNLQEMDLKELLQEVERLSRKRKGPGV